MKVAIIGGQGFLGRSLAKMLSAKGIIPLIYDLAVASGNLPTGAEFYPLDIIKDDIVFPDDLAGVFYLSHSPYYKSFPENASHLFGVNAWGPVKAAEAALKTKCRFFCYSSTGSVYADSFEMLSENAPLRKDSPYATSKIAAEDALMLFNGKMTVNIVRIFGLFGPGQKRMLPFILENKIRNGEAVQLQPSVHEQPAETGGLKISFCYVDDAATCLSGLLQKVLDGGTVPAFINLGGSEAVSIKAFVSMMAKKMNKDAIFTVSDSKRPSDLIADISTLKKTLPISFTPLEKAIEMTVSH